MKKTKLGFTLGEILICMMIIGIIMTLSASTLVTLKSSYTSLSYFTFKNMQTAVRELYAGQTAKTTDSNSAIMMCTRSDGKSVYVLKPDDYEPLTDEEIKANVQIDIPKCSKMASDVAKGTNTVCNLMVKMLNTTGKINCNNLYTAGFGDSDKDPSIQNLEANNPNFVTTNGQRYYLTKRTFNSSVSSEYGYRLLAVDLNGKSKPNKTNTSKKNPPDIITFMIMDNGELYPLGVAADNMKISSKKTTNYLSSKLKGYYYSDKKDRTQGIPSDCYLKTNSGTKQVCNYAVVNVQNDNKLSIYTYREAYCKSLGLNKTSTYEKYCYGITGNELCPPSTNEKRFDMCQVETIKPLFRFNLS